MNFFGGTACFYIEYYIGVSKVQVRWIASVSIKTDGVATVVRTGPILTNLVEILLDLA